MYLSLASDRHVNPEKREYRFITKEETLKLGSKGWTHLDVLCHDGKVRNVKVNGRVRTWKSNPDRIEVPYKYGMYDYGTLYWDWDRLTNGIAYGIVEE